MVTRDQLRGIWHSDPELPPECRDAVEARLYTVLYSWLGTPYSVHSAIKGRGADCIGFVSGVMDELYKKKFGLDLLPSPNGSSHQSAKFVEFFKKCRMLWPVENSSTIDSGDLVLERPKHGHGHIYIVGLPYTLWHCQHGTGVRQSDFNALPDLELEDLTFYKMLKKETWSL